MPFTLVIPPCGPALTCGYWEGEPVWFDSHGLPYTRADFVTAIEQLEIQRALTVVAIDREIADRRATIAQLDKMAARDE